MPDKLTKEQQDRLNQKRARKKLLRKIKEEELVRIQKEREYARYVARRSENKEIPTRFMILNERPLEMKKKVENVQQENAKPISTSTIQIGNRVDKPCDCATCVKSREQRVYNGSKKEKPQPPLIFLKKEEK